MTFRRFFPWIALLAAFALLSAQVLLASHEIEHLGYVDEEACEICLTGAALGPTLVSSRPMLALCANAPPTEPFLHRQTAVRSFYRSHLARAPPTPVLL